MNQQVHNAIVTHIRDASSAADSTGLASRFVSLTDEQLIHRMFINYRGGRGLRLTHFGLQVMQAYFQGYEINVPDDEVTQPLHLIFLDKRAKMPYHCGKGKIVVYDYVLGTKLRLVDGRLSTLMEIEMEDS